MKIQDTSENKNICFIANFYKTFFFHEIAKQFINEGYEIYWIVTKDSQYKFLKRYYNEKKILLIDRRHCLNHLEPLDDFKINELIYGDRVFKNEKLNGIKFLTNIQKPIYDFIKYNKINNIFGEKTWAHELLIHRIITKRKELNCRFFLIATTRIPNGRIFFYDDEKETEIVKPLVNSNKLVIGNRIKIEKPDYLLLNDKILSSANSLWGKLNRIKKLFTGQNIEKYDPNVQFGIYRFIIPMKEEFNRFSYKFVSKVGLNQIINHNYILFGFHKQPEASIDVCGRYFENQEENVLNLWRQLPPNWKLVIKEHSNAVGDRSYFFYKKILKYPNVILADEKLDSHMLIKSAQLVATNTGTMALEAALLGVPSITFSKVFFNSHNYCQQVNWNKLEGYPDLRVLIDEIKSRVDNTEEYSKYVIDSSFEGIVGDVDSNPNILNSDTIMKITNAINSIINQ